MTSYDLPARHFVMERWTSLSVREAILKKDMASAEGEEARTKCEMGLQSGFSK